VPATIALALVAFVIGVDGYIIAAVLPAVAEDLREPISAVGLVASAYSLPFALFAPLFAPLFGPLSDRRGRRFAILLGLAVFCVAAAACVLAPNLPMLITARAVNGLGAAITLPALLALAGDLPSLAERGRAISLVAGMIPLSSLLGLPLGALAAALAGWRAAFVLVLLVALAAFVLVFRHARQQSAPARDSRYLEPYRIVLSHPRAPRIMVVTLVWFFGAFGLFVYMAEFIHVSYGVPTDLAGLVYVAVGTVGVVATRLSGRVIAGVGPRRAVLVGLTLFVLAVFSLPLTTAALPLTVVAFSVWAFGVWLALPALQTIVAGLSSTARGTMLSFNTSAQNLGGVFGPAVTGAIIGAAGFSAAARWTSLVGLVALAIAWAVLTTGEAAASAVPAAGE